MYNWLYTLNRNIVITINYCIKNLTEEIIVVSDQSVWRHWCWYVIKISLLLVLFYVNKQILYIVNLFGLYNYSWISKANYLWNTYTNWTTIQLW